MFEESKRMAKAALHGALTGAVVGGAALFVIAPGVATKRQKAPFIGANIAHRGLHSRDKAVPENSLEAFRLAAEAGYAVELDVQLTKDGQVVVFHDDTLDRVCSVHARVDELTLSEIKKLRLCGTEYTVPLFTEVLNVIRGKSAIVCELKDGKRNRELCRKTYDIISEYKGDICIESFNPMIVAWFRFHAKELLRGQLAMPMREYPETMSLPLVFALSHSLFNCLARPQFIAYKIGFRPLPVRMSELLGAMRVGWTSHEPRNEKGRDAVIFEYYKPKLRFK